MRVQTQIGVALVALLLAFGANAQEQKVEIDTTVMREIHVVDANGEEAIKRVPATKVLPGETVLYTITARNPGVHPATNIVITDPIPEHMDYRAGSASGEGTSITFSIDGGKSYAVANALVVRDDDGSERHATPEEYTHIRWVFDDALAPGSSRSVQFRARLQ